MELLEHEEVNQPIDIIMPTHGRLDLTMSSVNALYENTRAPFHLIVVDDSTDLTPQYFEELKKEHTNITFIHSDEPYKSGNQIFNIGLQHGDSPFVVTVMNSVRVEPEWEVVGLKLMKDNPKIGAIGFKCLFPWGLIESAGIGMMSFLPIDLGRDQPGHRLTCIYECSAVQWAFAMLRKEAIIGKLTENTYKGLDEDTYIGFKGWDDLDNCFVLRKNGWQVFYCGLGVGYHTPRATRGTNTGNELDNWGKNQENSIIFYKRWGLWDKVKKRVEDEASVARKLDHKSWGEVKQTMRVK